MKLMMKSAFLGLLAKVLLTAAVMAPVVVRASTSEKPEGSSVRYFDIVIAYEGIDDGENGTRREIVRKVLEHFAYGIYQCSQGRHKLRKVVVYSNTPNDTRRFSQFSHACDIRWEQRPLHSNAFPGLDPCFGTDAQIVNNAEFPFATIHFSDKISELNIDLTSDSLTAREIRMAGARLAHEWGHYHYGVLDEYVKGSEIYGTRNYSMIQTRPYTGKDVSSIYGSVYSVNPGGKEWLPPFSEGLSADAVDRLKGMYATNTVIRAYYSSLMCRDYLYAFDWKIEESGYVNYYNCKQGDGLVPGELSSLGLCFSKTSDCYLENALELRSKNTVQYNICGMSSWDFVSSGKYAGCQIKKVLEEEDRKVVLAGNQWAKAEKDDFSGLGKGQQFLVKPFSHAIDCLDVEWNPPPVVVAVIDVSGSMQGAPIGNAKRGVSELISALPDGTFFALYTFSDTVSVKFNFNELSPDARRELGSIINEIPNPQGGTRIGTASGAALNGAVSLLENKSVSGAAVFLLSDGESQDNTLQYSQEFKKLNVPIYTFGYGNAASGDLPKLASITGGKYYYAPSGAAIQRAFQEASQLFGTRNPGSHGTIGGGGGSGGGGSSGSETEPFSQNFYVDSTMADLRLMVTYPSDTPSVNVADPADRPVAPLDVSTIGNETTSTYEVSPAVAGMWRIYGTRKVGAQIDYYYDSSVSIDSYRLAASAALVSVAGEERTYRVTASLRKEASINKANVVGRLYRDGSEVDTAVFDNTANGVYTAYLTISETPTTYSLSVTADNAAGTAYETFQDIIYEGAEPPADKPLGENFQRTVSVTFADGEPEAGAVMYVSASRGNDSNDGLTWAKAKRTIQAAINAVAINGTVVVTNGTYAAIVTHDKPLTITSVEGWEKTIIKGGGMTRCADL